MSSIDSKLQLFGRSLNEAIDDKEDNKTIDGVIKSYFVDTNETINNPKFCYFLLKSFISECLIPEESLNRYTLNESQLILRSKLIKKYIHNYIEYQLNLILVLSSIWTELQLSEDLLNKLINILHTNGIVSDEAFHHWFGCNANFEKRINAIDNCVKLLNWTQESREEYFYDIQDMDN
jgi:hypothetical protein